MTSGFQPINSGAPTPVPGVTGGPPVLGGQISNDPNDGSVVVAPNPGNVLQIRKGSQPTSLQVYEFFHTNTDFSRIALNSQTGGPFQLAVETAPSTLIRDLQIVTNGTLFINTGSSDINVANNQVEIRNSTTPQALLVYGSFTDSSNYERISIVATSSTYFVVSESAGTGTNRSLAIGTQGINSQLQFRVGGTDRWVIINTAHFVPASDNLYDIGTTGLRVRNGYFMNATVYGNFQFGLAFTLSATAGAATALPATPALYITVLDSGGTQRKIPAYNL